MFAPGCTSRDASGVLDAPADVWEVVGDGFSSFAVEVVELIWLKNKCSNKPQEPSAGQGPKRFLGHNDRSWPLAVFAICDILITRVYKG